MRIDHVALSCADMDTAVSFYEQHFGFQKYAEHDALGGALRIAYLRLADSVLELMAPAAGKAPESFHFCLTVDDFEAEVARLQAEGVELLTPPHPTAAREPGEENWRRVVFAGPDGEQIELRGPSSAASGGR